MNILARCNHSLHPDCRLRIVCSLLSAWDHSNITNYQEHYLLYINPAVCVSPYYTSNQQITKITIDKVIIGNVEYLILK